MRSRSSGTFSSMTPGKYDLALYRGDSYSWRFQLWRDPGRTQPLDLTGALVAAEIRDKPGGLTIVVLTCVVTLPNIVDVDLDAEAWVAAPMAGVWDLEVTMPDGTVQTPVAGKVSVTADVTGSLPVGLRTA